MTEGSQLTAGQENCSWLRQGFAADRLIERLHNEGQSLQGDVRLAGVGLWEGMTYFSPSGPSTSTNVRRAHRGLSPHASDLSAARSRPESELAPACRRLRKSEPPEHRPGIVPSAPAISSRP